LNLEHFLRRTGLHFGGKCSRASSATASPFLATTGADRRRLGLPSQPVQIFLRSSYTGEMDSFLFNKIRWIKSRGPFAGRSGIGAMIQPRPTKP
jgi:hypothetical protein